MMNILRGTVEAALFFLGCSAVEILWAAMAILYIFRRSHQYLEASRFTIALSFVIIVTGMLTTTSLDHYWHVCRLHATGL